MNLVESHLYPLSDMLEKHLNQRYFSVEGMRSLYILSSNTTLISNLAATDIALTCIALRHCGSPVKGLDSTCLSLSRAASRLPDTCSIGDVFETAAEVHANLSYSIDTCGRW